MTATVILPTTGAPELRQSLESVLDQSYPTQCYVVVDGPQFHGRSKVILDEYRGNKNLQICYLPENVGANGFYGHRIYAGFTHLVNTDYVLYLDQDNWFDSDHVEQCVSTLNSGYKESIQWCYSLRKIIDTDGTFICNDDCESLGKWRNWQDYNHIDTNCYCIRTEIAQRVASVWHGGWGQDRAFYSVLQQHFNNYTCTGKYTTNYRLGGNAGSVRKDFFLTGNELQQEQYKGVYPWQRRKRMW